MTTLTPPTLVEKTDLPRIIVRTRGGQARYYAYVNGYVLGQRCRLKGTSAFPLYYLSLVDMHGDGGKLQGVWAALISEPPADVYLENVGTVVLAHHDPQLESLGYRLHWNYDQATTNTRDNDLHAIVESNMLTMVDPIAGAAPKQRERKQRVAQTLHQKARKARASARVTLATASKKELGDLEERINREKHPLCLLLVPGNACAAGTPGEDGPATELSSRATYLAEQYFAFLDRRSPWPLSIDWADFLWQRGLATGENIKLDTWFKAVTQQREGEIGDGRNEDDGQKLPAIAEAWLCRPNLATLATDIQAAVKSGRISTLREAAAPVAIPEPAALALR